MNNRYRSKCRTVKGPKFNNIEIWNLRDILSRHIYKGLVQFKKAKRYGYPGTVTIDEWENILDKMIWAFREISRDYPNSPFNLEFKKLWKEHRDELLITERDENGNLVTRSNEKYPIYTEELKAKQKEFMKEIEEGKTLFVKYFDDLWD